jgi:hypothetical protein
MGCSTSVLECLVDLSSVVVVADAAQNVVLSLRLQRLWNVQTTESLGGLAGIIFGKVWAFKRCELGTTLLGGMTCSTDPSKGASMNRREAGLAMGCKCCYSYPSFILRCVFRSRPSRDSSWSSERME